MNPDQITAKSHQKTSIIAGDWNIDLLKHNTRDLTELFSNSLYFHFLLPLISRPSRFGLESSSLIQNIFTNKPSDASLSGLLISDISDHLLIFYITANSFNNNVSKYITIYSRHTTDENIQTFRNELQMTDCSDSHTNNNANEWYITFINRYNKIYNIIMTMTANRVKSYSNSNKPLISSGIVNSTLKKTLYIESI